MHSTDTGNIILHRSKTI